MVFAYYKRLTREQKRVYEASDRVVFVRLPRAETFQGRIEEISASLKGEKRKETEEACNRLISALAQILNVPDVRVQVLARRPSHSWGELHGLYEASDKGRRARMTVWMRTAQRRQVVAFRTFFRTLLHEFCHHLDFRLLNLTDSYHTEGFYKRESSLLHQLLGERG